MTSTRWTRELIDEAIDDTTTTYAKAKAYEQIADDLLADRDNLIADCARLAAEVRTRIAERDAALGAAKAKAESTWRLPDWLGGHEVEVLTTTLVGGTQLMRRLDGMGDDFRFEVEQLVEVRPPSIEDPVNLPLDIEGERFDGGGKLSVLCVEEPKIERPGYALFLGLHGDHIYLTAPQCRALAQAAWQRADAVESGPYSGPLGTRTEQARALANSEEAGR